jgi:hypothetical protein
MNKKDIIVKAMIDNPTKDLYYSYKYLKEYLFPESNLDQVKFLVDSILKEKPELLKKPVKIYNEGLSFQPSGLVEDFLKDGGFTKIESDIKANSDFLKDKELLEIQNLKLQNENSEYQKSIRDKEEQIRNLTKDSLRLGNWDIRFRWFIALISFIIGYVIKYLL